MFKKDLYLIKKINICYLIIISLFSINLYADIVKLSPKIRASDTNKNTTEYDIAAYKKDFLNIEILSNKQLKKLPRVISNYSNHLMIEDGDLVYVNNLNKLNYKKNIAIYRPEAVLNNKQSTDKQLRAMQFIADAKIDKLKLENNLSLLKIFNPNQEILPGDKVMVKHDLADFKITKNKNSKLKNKTGNIVYIIHGVDIANKGQSIIINWGKDQVKPGNILQIKKKIKLKRTLRFYEKDNVDTKDKNNAKYNNLPDKIIGKILVYRVFSNKSLALVIESDPNDMISLNDVVVI